MKNICGDFIVRASEPVTLTPNIRSPGLEHASQALSTYLVTPKDVSLNDAIAAKVQGRLDQKNVAYEQLVSIGQTRNPVSPTDIKPIRSMNFLR